MMLSFEKIDSDFTKIFNAHKVLIGAIKRYGKIERFHPAKDIIFTHEELLFISNYIRDRET